MKIKINKRITLLLLLVFICIISIPSALSMYREKQTKTLKATVTHPNYTLTADANGGSIPATTGWTGTGATATKTVTYGHEYGTLPTPTRTGYTFQGWNGKNLIKPLPNTITLYGITITPQSDGSVVLNGTKTGGDNYLGSITSSFLVKSNVQYIVSIGNYDSNIVLDYGLQGYARTKSINWPADFSSQGIHVYIGDGTVVSNMRLYPQIEEGTTATAYEPYYVTSSVNVTQAKNHTIKAIWEPRNDTAYVVNHYVHDLGTNTYTLNSTDNLTGTSDSEVTLANLKKTIAGFTYVDGYLTGGTTKPSSGAVTTTTISADGSRVINLYYRRNYLYVQYHVNGGQLAEQHGIYFGVTNSLVTSTGNTTPNKFWVGVYGSKVNAVTNANTYTQGTAGLDNYNNPNYLNLEKTGYTGKSGQEWNTNASGTGTSYSQATTTYDANDFGGADLSTGDQVVTLYVNWVPVDYEIMYDLQGGTLATSNPATYNIETNTFTLNNPTLTGYTFTGWTGSNGNTPEVNVTIPVGSYGDKAYVAHFSPIYEPETRIRSLNTIGTSIADDDPDSNLRYIGSNPNNYVSFNGQKWRIIGVFNGKLKIIQESIGSYSWDTSRNTVNNGYGVNQWGPSGTYTGADLMKLLNPGYSSNTDLKCNNTYSDGNCGTNDDSDYISGLVNNSLWWNAESGYCYNNINYKTTECDFTTTGLQSNTVRNMIDNATWYLGSNLASDNLWGGRVTASYLYNMEKSNNTGKQCSGGNTCNDDVTRTTTWQGKVGLIYPSDYVYATSGGTTHNRNTCLTVHSGFVENNSNVQNWNNTYTDCKDNDWLLNTRILWSISPRSTSGLSYLVFRFSTTASVSNESAYYPISVRPVVYLKSSIKFTTGDGSFNSPFNLIDTE